MRRVGGIYLVLGAIAAFSGCGDGSQTVVGPGTSGLDSSAPEAILDLSAERIGNTAAILRWTATGDNGKVGIASSYEIRYRETGVAGELWDSGLSVSNAPTPRSSGESEEFRIDDLNRDREYEFGIRAFDDAGNLSPVSNVVVVSAVPEITSSGPPVIKDVITRNGESLVQFRESLDSSGKATYVDVRYSRSLIDSSTWESESVLQAGSSELHSNYGYPWSRPIGVLEPGLWNVAIRIADESGNWSALSECYEFEVLSPPIGS